MKSLIFWLLLLTGAAARAAGGGFLFVTFNSEGSPMSEQIYFALSPDGRHWEALNHTQPVLVSTVGERGVRDPFLLRAPGGHEFHLLATDLSINHNGNWGRAVHEGSKSLVIWDSNDLVHWSEPRLVRVAAPDSGCTWAPEAIYDDETRDYLVFWASTNGRDHFAKQRIWAARTSDFRTFTTPFIYIQRPRAVIDTDIVHADNNYYRFSKDESRSAITMEVSPALMGPWREVPNFSLAQEHGFEGPECFLLSPASGLTPATWCLILDNYAKGAGYKPFVTNDLSSGQFTPASDFTFPFHFRHGSILPVSAQEYQSLETTYK